MAPLWAVLWILSAVWMFACIASPTASPVLPLILCVIFGSLWTSAFNRERDRKKQIEINDRLTRIEEQRDPKPIEVSTIPAGHVRKHIAGHQVDVPIDPPPGPTRLKNPHQQG